MGQSAPLSPPGRGEFFFSDATPRNETSPFFREFSVFCPHFPCTRIHSRYLKNLSGSDAQATDRTGSRSEANFSKQPGSGTSDDSVKKKDELRCRRIHSSCYHTHRHSPLQVSHSSSLQSDIFVFAYNNFSLDYLLCDRTRWTCVCKITWKPCWSPHLTTDKQIQSYGKKQIHLRKSTHTLYFWCWGFHCWLLWVYNFLF